MMGSVGQIEYRILERIHECVEAPRGWPEALKALANALSARIYLLEFDADLQHTSRFCATETAAPILQWLNGLHAEGINALQFLLRQADLHYPYWREPAPMSEQSEPPLPGSAEDWDQMSVLILPVFKSDEKKILAAIAWDPPMAAHLRLDDVLTAFRPYARGLSNALALSERLARAEGRQHALTSMLLHQKHPAFLVATDLTILFQTPSAQVILEEGVLFGQKGRHLVPVHPSLDQALSSLRRFLSGVRRPLSRQLLMAAVSEPEKSVFLNRSNSGHCHIHLQGIVPDPDRQHLQEAGYILIEVRKSTAITPQIREFLQTNFGLSQSEARLAHDLSLSGSLATTLNNLGITRNTAKTHLRRIYEKTETQSQLELAQLLHRLGGLF